jgi:hypothetical protein
VTGVLAALNPLNDILGWVALLLLPVCLVWAVWSWEDWRNDLYRLDKERVYHVESLPFGLREESTETLVSRITDVSYSVPGPLSHLLNFGNVLIKTPGESSEIVFKGIPRPREVQGEIMARVDEHRLKDQADMEGEIEAWIKAYDDVKREKELSPLRGLPNKEQSPKETSPLLSPPIHWQGVPNRTRREA